MAVTSDDSPKFQQYAHPDRLVSTEWLAAAIADGSARPGGDIVVVESDEDVLLYDTGHIPGSVKVDWHIDLNDPLTRDYVDGAALRRGAWASGASAATRPSSSTATRATGGPPTRCGSSSLFGHEDVRLLDGGRAKWIAEGRELTRDVPEPDAGGLPRRRARRRADPRLQGRRARPPRQAAGRRPLPRRVLRRAAAHARLPAGGGHARRPHPRREVGAVGARGRRGRHVQVRGPTSRRSTSPSRASTPTTTWSPTAGSASARRTPGSS